MAAAERATAERLCRVSLVGSEEAVEQAAREAGVPLTVPVLDPIREPDLPHLAARLTSRMAELRGGNPVDPAEVERLIDDTRLEAGLALSRGPVDLAEARGTRLASDMLDEGAADLMHAPPVRNQHA